MSLGAWIRIMTIMPICFPFICALPSYRHLMHHGRATSILHWFLISRTHYPIFLTKSMTVFSTCFPNSTKIHLQWMSHRRPNL
ncbi:hypothetical protein EV421DRAFT_1806699 [Armillaria borealis]|uniref:Uncharacterized protein n=1 Tax=Armillaria borealis TaxID=47425 RepID=A0AA39JK97_9AGAR|nr:hypothetical protein EV421DRAFT_1806699 [Armillaria borealis]